MLLYSVRITCSPKLNRMYGSLFLLIASFAIRCFARKTLITSCFFSTLISGGSVTAVSWPSLRLWSGSRRG